VQNQGAARLDKRGVVAEALEIGFFGAVYIQVVGTNTPVSALNLIIKSSAQRESRERDLLIALLYQSAANSKL
jgi:hypothetical protein